MLRTIDRRIVEQFVAARRALGLTWPEYAGQFSERMVDAMLWEHLRQQKREMARMWGLEETPKTPKLNQLRKEYLEVYAEIAEGRCKPDVG